MFLANSNGKYNDLAQSSHLNGSSSGFSFPTSILENLLQNSDLLETLMKPISNGNNDIILDEKMCMKKKKKKKKK
jgi:hypothetical protein